MVPSRSVKVTETCALLSSRRRTPLSSAGMTLVSLNTSASPGCEQIGQIADHAIGERLLGRWIDHQQPRRVARGDRAQRD